MNERLEANSLDRSGQVPPESEKGTIVTLQTAVERWRRGTELLRVASVEHERVTSVDLERLRVVELLRVVALEVLRMCVPSVDLLCVCVPSVELRHALSVELRHALSVKLRRAPSVKLWLVPSVELPRVSSVDFKGKQSGGTALGERADRRRGPARGGVRPPSCAGREAGAGAGDGATYSNQRTVL